MRGFPLFRLALVAVALALLGIPVWSLTREKPAAPVVVAEVVPEKRANFEITLVSSAPAALRVMSANQPTRSSENAVSRFETSFEMNAAQPEDLAVFADFSDKTSPHAVRAEVRSGGRVLADSTFWGTGVVEDVVEIPAP